MKLLGAIVAGGGAVRFGEDKGAASLDGVALIDHVVEGLRGQVDDVVIVGRAWPGLVTIADRPRAGLGPLGGLCGALHHAAACAFDAVVMTPCDLLPVPAFAAIKGPAVVAGHEICGIWSVDRLAELEGFVATAPKLSMKAWIAHSGAVAIVSSQEHFDLNTPEALARFRARA